MARLDSDDDTSVEGSVIYYDDEAENDLEEILLRHAELGLGCDLAMDSVLLMESAMLEAVEVTPVGMLEDLLAIETENSIRVRTNEEQAQDRDVSVSEVTEDGAKEAVQNIRNIFALF